MLRLTIVLILALLIVSFLIFDRDILAPPTVVALVFLFASFCTLYNEGKWGIEFSPRTMLLITSAIIATIAGGMIGVILSNYFCLRESLEGFFSFSYKKDEPERIYINSIKTSVVIVFQIVTILLIIVHIRRVTGLSDLMKAIHRYREAMTSRGDVASVSVGLPILTRNMAQISKMTGIVYAYIIGNNLIAEKRFLSLNWLPVILYSLTTFVQGDRSQMIRLWLTILIVTYTIYKRSIGWKKSWGTMKVALGMAVSVGVVGYLFSSIRQFVGRDSSADPLYYLTFYAGSPIAVLDQLWRSPIPKPEIWGRKTFYYLNQSLTVLFGWPGRYSYYSPDFTSPSGAALGNAPTALRDPYVEFGFWGFIILMTGFGLFYTLLYCKCRARRGNRQIDFHLLLYTFIAYTYYMYFYASFNEYLSHIFIKYAIELWLIRWVLVGWQFRQTIVFRFGKTECCSYFKNT